MNYYKSKLNLIRVALGIDVKMADAVLEDGVTRVEAESFEAGSKIFVVSEDGERAPAPEGVHTAQDGTKITVDSEGTITLVEAPEPVEAEEVEVQAAEEEVKEEVKAESKEDDLKPAMLEEIVDRKIEEAMEKVFMALEEVVKEVSEVKEEMASYREKMSKAPASKKVSTFNSEVPSNDNVLESRLEHLKELKSSLGKNKNF